MQIKPTDWYFSVALDPRHQRVLFFLITCEGGGRDKEVGVIVLHTCVEEFLLITLSLDTRLITRLAQFSRNESYLDPR